MLNQNIIRQQMLQQRKLLTHQFIQEQSDIIKNHLHNLIEFQNSQNIGCYWPFSNEVDTQLIIKLCWELGKNCYLPKISANFQMNYFAYDQDTILTTNSLGIVEPQDTQSIAVTDLDLVLVPVVAFDQVGHRLGFGLGYYDRCFAFHLATPHTKPILIGLAYQFQQVECLIQNSWDVPLDIILTEKKILYC